MRERDRLLKLCKILAATRPGCLSVSTDKRSAMLYLYNGTDMTDMSNYIVTGGNAESNRKGLLLATTILMYDKTGTNQGTEHCTLDKNRGSGGHVYKLYHFTIHVKYESWFFPETFVRDISLENVLLQILVFYLYNCKIGKNVMCNIMKF